MRGEGKTFVDGILQHPPEKFKTRLLTISLDYEGTVLWTRYDVDETLAYLRERGHEAPFDWTTGDDLQDQLANQENGVHLRLMIGEILATSFGLVIRKGDQTHGTH